MPFLFLWPIDPTGAGDGSKPGSGRGFLETDSKFQYHAGG
jgi:hypothetical protein